MAVASKLFSLRDPAEANMRPEPRVVAAVRSLCFRVCSTHLTYFSRLWKSFVVGQVCFQFTSGDFRFKSGKFQFKSDNCRSLEVRIRAEGLGGPILTCRGRGRVNPPQGLGGLVDFPTRNAQCFVFYVFVDPCSLPWTWPRKPRQRKLLEFFYVFVGPCSLVRSWPREPGNAKYLSF